MTWNSGTMSNDAGWAFTSASGGGVPRIAAATPLTMMFWRFASAWRCVSVAPLG